MKTALAWIGLPSKSSSSNRISSRGGPICGNFAWVAALVSSSSCRAMPGFATTSLLSVTMIPSAHIAMFLNQFIYADVAKPHFERLGFLADAVHLQGNETGGRNRVVQVCRRYTVEPGFD